MLCSPGSQPSKTAPVAISSGSVSVTQRPAQVRYAASGPFSVPMGGATIAASGEHTRLLTSTRQHCFTALTACPDDITGERTLPLASANMHFASSPNSLRKSFAYCMSQQCALKSPSRSSSDGAVSVKSSSSQQWPQVWSCCASTWQHTRHPLSSQSSRALRRSLA